jgi:tripartite-type tricarboxylate transporter receptor subunit TctC
MCNARQSKKSGVNITKPPDIKDYFTARGFIVDGTTPEAFKTFIASEVKKWTPIVRSSGVQAD